MNPKLTIIVLAYNVEKYIEQTLDSILAQKVNFPYQILIGNDGSNDGTVAILERYKAQHPDLITLHLTPREVRKHGGDYINFSNLFFKTTSKYFTVLDGDDYWIDEYKLQKQIDFLDQNPDFTVCGHNYFYLYEDGKMEKSYDEERDGNRYDFIANNFEELLLGGHCPYMQTSSLIYRNIFANDLSVKKMFTHHMYKGDFIRTLFHAQKGKSKYINEVMSVYRIINGGDWSRLSEIERAQSHINFFEFHRDHTFDKKYKIALDTAISRYYDLLILELSKEKSFESKLKSLFYKIYVFALKKKKSLLKLLSKKK